MIGSQGRRVSVTEVAAGFETVRRPHRTVAAVLPAVVVLAVAAWVGVAGWAVPSPDLAPAERVSAVHVAETDPADDVTVQRCSNAVFVGAAAWGNVTNGSSARADYRISLSFDSGRGLPLATAAVVVESVDPGTSAAWEAAAFVDGGIVTNCRVAKVERVPS